MYRLFDVGRRVFCRAIGRQSTSQEIGTFGRVRACAIRCMPDAGGLSGPPARVRSSINPLFCARRPSGIVYLVFNSR